MQTLLQQGVSIITQTRTILSAKYGYIINAGYSDDLTELTSADDSELIRIMGNGEEITFSISLSIRDDERAKEITQLVTDVIDIVKILN